MFKNILVPLDGSPLSETALPAASHLAVALGARITLVHVVEENAPSEVHGEPHLQDQSAAEAYLRAVAQRAFPPEVPVQCHVHEEVVARVPDSIVSHVGEFGSDLIVMCSHGQGGMRDFLIGSIAQQVISIGQTPTLVIHPAANVPAEFHCRHLLVPLDGHPDHEQGLAVAADLARICDGSLYLIMVIPTPGKLTGGWTATRRLMPGATAQFLDMQAEEAERYLARHTKTLRQQGVTTSSKVFRGDPAPAILEAADRLSADLIVLGTHGTTGMEAFMEGTLIPRLSARGGIPLLLVPVRPTR